MESTFRLMSLNMHKGMNSLNSQHTLHRLGDLLLTHSADLIFLQEVQGEHTQRANQWQDWPLIRQDAFLAKQLGLQTVYGGNAFYPHGHHGNAIISRYDLLSHRNLDISQNRMEHRGMLHASFRLAEGGLPLHAICVHLNLLGRDRKKQLHLLIDEIQHQIPKDEPIILAGDFNDWQNEASHLLLLHLGMKDVSLSHYGRLAKTFPARWPLLPLDRIYIRHLQIEQAAVGDRFEWRGISDHLPLMATLRWS